jgi:hypothetical protein
VALIGTACGAGGATETRGADLSGQNVGAVETNEKTVYGGNIVYAVNAE